MLEERMRVLKMLEDGKVNAEEAAKLLAALEEGGKEGHARAERKLLHIEVKDDSSERPRVNVNIPLELVSVGLQMIPADTREKLKGRGFDLENIIKLIQTGVEGKLVEVEHEKKDGKERVVVEIE